MTASQIINEISNYRPVTILIGEYVDIDPSTPGKEWTRGHFVTIIGYVDTYMGENQTRFFIYDVHNFGNTALNYRWVTYAELTSGENTYLDGRLYDDGVHSN